jgi:hypothetical protein
VYTILTPKTQIKFKLKEFEKIIIDDLKVPEIN